MNKLFSFCILLICLSCVDDTEVSVDIPDRKAKLTLFSTIQVFEPSELPPGVTMPVDTSLKTSIYINLSKTGNIFDTLKPVVKDALVVLYRNGLVTDTAKYIDSLEQYFCICKTEASDEIRITAHSEGADPVEAIATIPSKVNIDSLEILLNSGSVGDEGYNELTICFADPKNEINFYELSTDGSLIKSNESFITSQPYYPPEYDVWAISLDALYFSDETFNGEQVSLTAYYNGPVFYGPQNICLRSISEGYFKYRTSFLQQQYRRRSNSYFKQSEPVEVYSNVKNGYGVLGAYQSSTKRFMIINGEVRQQYE